MCRWGWCNNTKWRKCVSWANGEWAYVENEHHHKASLTWKYFNATYLITWFKCLYMTLFDGPDFARARPFFSRKFSFCFVSYALSVCYYDFVFSLSFLWSRLSFHKNGFFLCRCCCGFFFVIVRSISRFGYLTLCYTKNKKCCQSDMMWRKSVAVRINVCKWFNE